jgi:hypothetical protein
LSLLRVSNRRRSHAGAPPIPFTTRRFAMMLIREIMYCKPGKVKALIEKFLAMNELAVKAGMPKMRVMTDFATDRYWTLVAEMETPSLQDFEDMMSGRGKYQADEATMKKFDEVMKGYHDLVDGGRREIYKLEN